MAAWYLIVALIIQNCLTESIIEDETSQIESREILRTKPDVDDGIMKDFQATTDDWMDAFIGSNTNIFPTSSAALMAQATLSNKSPEEQLEDIKEIANQISQVIQSEMANLLSYAISCTEKEEADNKLRKKRSVESPMDSSQLVMRLLKHIKSNNEYQNIAIEKMMSAQEIADKYGISFTPDPETLSDLALAANEQAREMSDILKDAIEQKNITQTLFPLEFNNDTSIVESILFNSTEHLEHCEQSKNNASIKVSNFLTTEKVGKNNIGYDHPASHYNYYYNYPYESQIAAPPSQHYSAPVSQRPNFYDIISYNPNQDNMPYCSMEPYTTSSVFLPIDDLLYNEPELVAEEYEETVSSKVFIDHDEEPGVSSVNHVMSYTISEKSYFKTPHIESLPEQMQYYFYLM